MKMGFMAGLTPAQKKEFRAAKKSFKAERVASRQKNITQGTSGPKPSPRVVTGTSGPKPSPRVVTGTSGPKPLNPSFSNQMAKRGYSKGGNVKANAGASMKPNGKAKK